MPIEFKTEEERNPILGRVPKNRDVEPKPVEENLAQPILSQEEEMRMAIQFIEENELYTKFLLWCGIQDQLKKLQASLDNPIS